MEQPPPVNPVNHGCLPVNPEVSKNAVGLLRKPIKLSYLNVPSDEHLNRL